MGEKAMNDRTITRHTWIFVAFLLLAGAANVLSVTGNPVPDALMTSCNYLILTGLLLYWFQSVRARLLPSRSKTWVMGAALMMLLYQLLRVFKYRFATEPAMIRHLVYLYFAPMTLIPALFLMTSLRIHRANRPGRWDEALILIPSGLLILLALTNDLHGLVYAPRAALSGFAVEGGTYTHGPVFYALYAWMILGYAIGLLLLLREARLRYRKALTYLVAVAGLWLGLLAYHFFVTEGTLLPHMYNNPEIHMFGMLGIFEVCIRSRMIPHNGDYPGFFRMLQTSALVTDRELRPVYRSGNAPEADPGQLRAALASPVYLTPDLKLSGQAVHGGYAFWTEDETEVHRAQERLLEANELIESESSLIRAETEQREKDAWLQSRHRIYHEIAEILYPCQKRIEELLGRMEPNTPAFRDQLAQVSVLNAYVKRKTNLLLLASEQDTLSIQALFQAIRESANYLSLAGLQTGALQPEEELALPAAAAIALYDAFEAVAEQMMGHASSLMVSWRGTTLSLATAAKHLPDLDALPVTARTRQADGILYMDLLAEAKAKKGGGGT